jgi:hypothetical protein
MLTVPSVMTETNLIKDLEIEEGEWGVYMWEALNQRCYFTER